MILLDTHTLYWYLCEEEKLSFTARECIEKEKDVYVSIVTFWEMAIKESLGRLELPVEIDQMIIDIENSGFHILPIEGGHLTRLKSLPWLHRDPFDRLLICQAQSENLVLITKDDYIKQYDVQTLW